MTIQNKSMDQSIKISIVIPVYNAQKYLRMCVDSALEQTYRDFEIILVDDGSSDSSGDICDDYERRYPFVRAVHKPNGGASSARNAGMKEARGEYIHFIDSDDMLALEKVYEQLAEKALDGENEIVFFRRERVREDGGETEAVQPEYKIDGVFAGDVLGHVLENKYEMTLTCPVNKIFLRKLLLDNELYFREGLEHEEDEWLPRVVSCAHRVWFDRGVYYTVRNHPGSMSRDRSEERNAARACSKVYIAASGIEYMEPKKLPPDTMAMIASYYWDYLIDACVECGGFKAKENRERVIGELEKNKSFFESSRYLKSRNRRFLGVMFRLLGIRTTVYFIGRRYEK